MMAKQMICMCKSAKVKVIVDFSPTLPVKQHLECLTDKDFCLRIKELSPRSMEELVLLVLKEEVAMLEFWKVVPGNWSSKSGKAEIFGGKKPLQ